MNIEGIIYVGTLGGVSNIQLGTRVRYIISAWRMYNQWRDKIMECSPFSERNRGCC